MSISFKRSTDPQPANPDTALVQKTQKKNKVNGPLSTLTVNGSLSVLSGRMLCHVMSFAPDSALAFAQTSSAAHQIAIPFLHSNAQDILAQCSNAQPLFQLLCSNLEKFKIRLEVPSLCWTFHVTTLSTVRSLGIEKADCPDHVLSSGEIIAYNDTIQDTNLREIWRRVGFEILSRNPGLQGVPRANATAQEIRTWLSAADWSVMVKVIKLDLSKLRLTCIPEEIRLFPGLQELDLSHNQLRSIPGGAFNGLTQLKTLSLNDNFFESIQRGAFHGLSSVKDLYLGHNQLTSLSRMAFEGMTSLEKLNLVNNKLVTIPRGAFYGLDALEKLFLFKNRLTTLETETFIGLTSLKTLYLDDNQLKDFHWDCFKGLPSLESLGLSRNGLTSLPVDVFQGLTALKDLSLVGNELASLPDGIFWRLFALETVNLNNNPVESFPEGFFNGLPAIRNVFTSKYTFTYSHRK